RLLAIEYVGERIKYLVVRRNIPSDVTYYLGNKDRVIKVEPGQQTKKIGKELETILGEDGFDKLQGELAAGRAAIGLVYLGEDGKIHHLWSATLEYNLRKHPATEILGLHVVKMNGISAVELGGASVRLVPSGDEYKLLVEGVEDLEAIPLNKPFLELSSQDYANLKMPLLGGEVLSIQVNVDEQGKLYCSNLKIQDGNTFYDLKILEYASEIKNYYYERQEITLKDLLVTEYTDLSGETHTRFIDLTGEIPKGILHKLAGHPTHSLLEIKALKFFNNKGYQILGVEKYIKVTEDQWIFPDLLMKDPSGQETLGECKHGWETDVEDDMRQAKDYFTYTNLHNDKIVYYFGGDIVSEKAKDLLRYILKLHEQFPNVPLEIYIKEKLMNLDELKFLVGG
ncbi:MAG: hypothetical protein FGF50_11315, partial [Candidatus Brockarchaeota archaeon]|nr:hypothetical protein [Candidatus Brockarchaeota archaeon]